MFKKTKKIWRISSYQNYARPHILRKFGFDVGKLKTAEFYEISEMIYEVFELSGSFEMYDFLGKGVIEERFTEKLIQKLQERNYLSKSSSNQPLGNTKKFGEEQLKPRAKTPPTKTVNYTPEMVSQMAEMAPLNLEKAQALSNTLGRSVRSIIAKAKREGIAFESVEPVANRVKGQTKAASPKETQLVKPKNSVTKQQVSKSINDKTISVAAVNQEKEKTQSNSKPYVGKFFLASSVVAVLVLYGILSINENPAPDLSDRTVVYRASIQSLELSNAATPRGYFSVEDHDIGTINESFEWQYQETL